MTTRKLKYSVTCTYDRGIQEAKDKAAFDIGDANGGEFVGSGCMLQDNFQRDLQFLFTTREAARAAAKALKLAQFDNVEIRPRNA
jgi:hypothetical protein